MTMCPRDCGRPSRKAQSYRGRIPLCQPCFDAQRKGKEDRWRRLRSSAFTAEDRQAWFKDDPPQVIEQKFQAALKAIRARRHP